jgi:hypothetical protein
LAKKMRWYHYAAVLVVPLRCGFGGSIMLRFDWLHWGAV